MDKYVNISRKSIIFVTTQVVIVWQKLKNDKEMAFGELSATRRIESSLLRQLADSLRMTETYSLRIGGLVSASHELSPNLLNYKHNCHSER